MTVFGISQHSAELPGTQAETELRRRGPTVDLAAFADLRFHAPDAEGVAKLGFGKAMKAPFASEFTASVGHQEVWVTAPERPAAGSPSHPIDKPVRWRERHKRRLGIRKGRE